MISALDDLSAASRAAPPTDGTLSFGLFFVVDMEFLRSLHTMIFSMWATGSLCTLPLTVITTQQAVCDDPIIRRVADRIRLLTEEELRPFQDIPREQVKEGQRHADVPKYSFLKWFVMEDYGYDFNIYLDTDMVCLDPVNGPLEVTGDVDLAVAGRWPQTLQTGEAGLRSQTEIDANVMSFLQGFGETWPWQPNSGVLVLGKRMMRPDVVPELFAVRKATRTGFDQGPLGDWLTRNPAIRVKRLAESYNVNQGHIGLLTSTKQAKALGQVKVLHFISLKPWEQPKNWRLSHRYWHVIDREARQFYLKLGFGA